MARGDPGVPDALPRVVLILGRRLGPETLDRLWLFPPLRQGRRESGLVAASCFVDGAAGNERRRVVTASYKAEVTGKGMTLDPILREEGEAPPEVLARVVNGVLRRSGLDLGEPREVEVAGDPVAFAGLLDEIGSDLSEEPSKAGAS